MDRSFSSTCLRGIMRGVASIGLLALVSATPAYATLFRYGHIAWLPIGGNDVVFTVQTAWRTENTICVDPKTSATKACTGAQGAIKVGDVVRPLGEDPQNGEDPKRTLRLQFGDRGVLSPLLFLVTLVDDANGWFLGLAIDQNAVGAASADDLITATLIRHSYAEQGSYQISLAECCRIPGTGAPPNFHVNNPKKSWAVTARVNTGTLPPAVAMPPIVACQSGSPCPVTFDARGLDGGVPTFALSDPGSAGGTNFVQPPGFSLVAGNQFSWDTDGVEVEGQELNTLYSTQVQIQEGGVNGDGVVVDLFLRLIPSAQPNNPPEFVDSQCGQVVSIVAGAEYKFTVRALGKALKLGWATVPQGATVTPATHNGADDQSYEFSWTPTPDQLGITPLLFAATNGDPVAAGDQAFCPVTLSVLECTGVGDCTAGRGCTRTSCVAGRCVYEPDDSRCDPPAHCTSRVCEPGVAMPPAGPDGCVAHELQSNECCANCLDDDADGATDLEDDDCCTGYQGKLVDNLPGLPKTVRRRSGKIRMKPALEIGLRDIVDSLGPTESLSFYLRKGDQSLMCTKTPPKSSWSGALDVKGGMQLVPPTQPPPAGLTSATLRRTKENRVRLNALATVSPQALRAKGSFGLSVGANGNCVKAGKFSSP